MVETAPQAEDPVRQLLGQAAVRLIQRSCEALEGAIGEGAAPDLT